MSTAQKNGHAAAYQAWFCRFEAARKARHIAPGRKVPGFPAPPPGPDEVRRLVDRLGDAKCLDLAGVHRTTLLRWQSGAVQIPDAAYSVLLFAADGIPPGCGEAWRGFHWADDALICPDGKTRVTAHEIAGLHYQRAHIEALQRRVSMLENRVIDLVRRIGTDGAANDAFIAVSGL